MYQSKRGQLPCVFFFYISWLSSLKCNGCPFKKKDNQSEKTCSMIQFRSAVFKIYNHFNPHYTILTPILKRHKLWWAKEVTILIGVRSYRDSCIVIRIVSADSYCRMIISSCLVVQLFQSSFSTRVSPRGCLHNQNLRSRWIFQKCAF